MKYEGDGQTAKSLPPPPRLSPPCSYRITSARWIASGYASYVASSSGAARATRARASSSDQSLNVQPGWRAAHRARAAAQAGGREEAGPRQVWWTMRGMREGAGGGGAGGAAARGGGTATAAPPPGGGALCQSRPARSTGPPSRRAHPAASQGRAMMRVATTAAHRALAKVATIRRAVGEAAAWCPGRVRAAFLCRPALTGRKGAFSLGWAHFPPPSPFSSPPPAHRPALGESSGSGEVEGGEGEADESGRGCCGGATPAPASEEAEAAARRRGAGGGASGAEVAMVTVRDSQAPGGAQGRPVGGSGAGHRREEVEDTKNAARGARGEDGEARAFPGRERPLSREELRLRGPVCF